MNISDDENGDEDAGSEIASEWGDMRDDFSVHKFSSVVDISTRTIDTTENTK